MHVELFGLPGSGKTTVAEDLSDRYVESAYRLHTGYKVGVCRRVLTHRGGSVGRNVPLPVVYRLADLLRLPPDRQVMEYGEFVQLANRLLKRYTGEPARRTTVHEWVEKLVVWYGWSNQLLTEADVLLCDEGFLQRANAIFCPPHPSKSLNRTDIEAYLKSMPKPDAVILLDVPVDVAERRILTRTSGPPRSFGGHEKEERLQRLESMASYIDHVASICDGKSGSFVRIENTDSPREACDDIVRELF